MLDSATPTLSHATAVSPGGTHRAIAKEGGAGVEGASRPEGEETSTSQTTRVLMVDDRPANLLAYRVILEPLEIELVTADSGEDALRELTGGEFAVVLLDVNMPGMDGFATAQAIRQNQSTAHVPIIFLTAYSGDFDAAEAYAQGAVDFIETPVVPAVLRAKVKVFADLFRMTAELSRRKHEALVRENGERMRLILDSSLDAVVSIDDQGRITGWNPQAEGMFGWTRSEAVGNLLADLVIPEPYRVAHTRGLEYYRASGVGPLLNKRVELSAIRKEGGQFPIELTISPLQVGNRHEFCAFVRDTSQRKAAEEQIRRYARELERSNQELNEFAYSASHDLRSPLRAIGQMAEWIVEDHGRTLPEVVRHDLDLMRGRVARMQRLLDDLLEYARVGHAKDELTHVDCAAMVREIVDLLPVPAGFTVAVGPLPTLLTHRAPLEQVLRNLIGNAVKHHHRPDGRIEIAAEDRAEAVEFIVRDDGPGIAAQYHDQVFQMFTTLKPRDTVEGSGMGLALVKKIIESRGGWIRLESAEDHGATFRFSWPPPRSLEK